MAWHGSSNQHRFYKIDNDCTFCKHLWQKCNKSLLQFSALLSCLAIHLALTRKLSAFFWQGGFSKLNGENKGNSRSMQYVPALSSPLSQKRQIHIRLEIQSIGIKAQPKPFRHIKSVLDFKLAISSQTVIRTNVRQVFFA